MVDNLARRPFRGRGTAIEVRLGGAVEGLDHRPIAVPVLLDECPPGCRIHRLALLCRAVAPSPAPARRPLVAGIPARRVAWTASTRESHTHLLAGSAAGRRAEILGTVFDAHALLRRLSCDPDEQSYLDRPMKPSGSLLIVGDAADSTPARSEECERCRLAEAASPGRTCRRSRGCRAGGRRGSPSCAASEALPRLRDRAQIGLQRLEALRVLLLRVLVGHGRRNDEIG